MTGDQKPKKKLNKLDKYLIFSISATILYTVVNQIIFLITRLEMSTLTTCFFAAFAGEILSCAAVKVFNLKNENCAGAIAKTEEDEAEESTGEANG